VTRVAPSPNTVEQASEDHARPAVGEQACVNVTLRVSIHEDAEARDEEIRPSDIMPRVAPSPSAVNETESPTPTPEAANANLSLSEPSFLAHSRSATTDPLEPSSPPTPLFKDAFSYGSDLSGALPTDMEAYLPPTIIFAPDEDGVCIPRERTT